eukprot:369889_1
MDTSCLITNGGNTHNIPDNDTKHKVTQFNNTSIRTNKEEKDDKKCVPEQPIQITKYLSDEKEINDTKYYTPYSSDDDEQTIPSNADEQKMEQNILLVRTNENSSHLISKYQNNSNEILEFIEYFRWKLNLLLLFRPFVLLSYIPIPYHLHQWLYRLTFEEIVFYTVLIV